MVPCLTFSAVAPAMACAALPRHRCQVAATIAAALDMNRMVAKALQAVSRSERLRWDRHSLRPARPQWLRYPLVERLFSQSNLGYS